jgi:RNA polymerase sigma-54 factor
MQPQIHINLKQSLKLNPNIEQSIQLLKSNEAEIELIIQEYLNKNPYLELDETDMNNIGVKKKEFTPKEELISNYEISSKSLKEHLFENIFDLGFNLEDEILARLIIEYIDENGYLEKDYFFFINQLDPEIKVTKQAILFVIQQLNKISTPGIGARSIDECLLFQLREFKETEIIRQSKKIIENHLKDLANKNFIKISKILKLNIETIQKCNKLIKTLNPKPGLSYLSNSTSDYIIPDIKISTLNDKISVLLINNYESLKLVDITKNEIKDNEAFNQAKWFIGNINYRKINIIKIVNYIIEYHHDFLKSKILNSPFTIKMVAEKLDIHESTVSRIINDKYIETPHGVLEMKSFFTHKLSNQSNKEILKKLKNIIENEDKKKPLSDFEIYLTLLKENITISRRTISKYRQKLGILASSQRKDEG